MGVILLEFLKAWSYWLLICLKDILGRYKDLGPLYFHQNSVAIVLLPIGPECWEGWRQTEFSIFIAWKFLILLFHNKFGNFTAMWLSVDIFVSVFFAESEYAFSFCIFESLFQEVIFYYIFEIFYITFGVFNNTNCTFIGSPLSVFHL